MGQLRDRLGGDPFWTRDEVLGHGFDFRPMWRKRRVPSETWTSSLSDLPDARRGRQYRHITRGDLLTATNNRPDDIGRLLVGCYAWGTGDLGFLVGRRAQVFVKNSPDAITNKLAKALAVLRGTGPVDAYEVLARGNECHTPYLGPSFYTKLLYAADARPEAEAGTALILDQFVAIALNKVEGWDLPEQGPWDRDQYQRWLDFAHNHARNESTEDAPVRPDAVEAAMFRRGRAIYRKRRAAGG
ncbi:hypothetical protein [Micromonospora sp. CMU55-4]|uniref:8-oxoguanine DNA glycosylase OGG fold protein n=1 Tax=Micromonospora sp. CMU55-4 TaxID=2717028 RepID=UPI001407C89A|nr:hypothetical protein [Micromonospora sp. CMU55-4]NHO82131.1 hypothetical protein [Micromonospora sp. CMU55-4]